MIEAFMIEAFMIEAFMIEAFMIEARARTRSAKPRLSSGMSHDLNPLSVDLPKTGT
jgi:hypothetical protein